MLQIMANTRVASLVVVSLLSITTTLGFQVNRTHLKDRIKSLVHTSFDPPEKPSRIITSLSIEGVTRVSAKQMTMQVNLWLVEKWRETRLWSGNDSANLADRVNYGGSVETFPDMWSPDIAFLEVRKMGRPYKTTLNILGSGDVTLRIKYDLEAHCSLCLEKYPFDKHECFVSLESFSYKENEVQLIWDKSNGPPIKWDIVRTNRELPSFNMLNISGQNCPHNRTEDSYSCLQARFFFIRELGTFWIGIYVPSILVVILSWVNFYLDPLATPARGTLLVVTVLTIITKHSDARDKLPEVAYSTAMDQWFTVCLSFIFAALVEFATVNVIYREQKAEQAQHDRRSPGRNMQEGVHERIERDKKDDMELVELHGPEDDTGDHGKEQEHRVGHKRRETLWGCLTCTRCRRYVERNGRNVALCIDRISKLVFPLGFVLFNVYYWSHYWYSADGDQTSDQCSSYLDYLKRLSPSD